MGGGGRVGSQWGRKEGAELEGENKRGGAGWLSSLKVVTSEKIGGCAARAFCDCPAIISHRPRSQNILKEPALNPEKDSRIKRPRSQVSLEKSSQNYKPLEK
jgi:hypothetical protein